MRGVGEQKLYPRNAFFWFFWSKYLSSLIHSIFICEVRKSIFFSIETDSVPKFSSTELNPIRCSLVTSRFRSFLSRDNRHRNNLKSKFYEQDYIERVIFCKLFFCKNSNISIIHIHIQSEPERKGSMTVPATYFRQRKKGAPSSPILGIDIENNIFHKRFFYSL